MPKIIQPYTLSRHSHEPQRLQMPRRARITGIQPKVTTVIVFAEIDHDADTRALDTNRHERTFVVCREHQVVPEGGLVGFSDGIHLYEVKTA